MVSFFKINDPFRILILLVVGIVMLYPIYAAIEEPPLSVYRFMLLGEKMNSGGLIYADIETSTGPLAAFSYQLLDGLFGKSVLAYQLIGFVFMFLQAVLFNRMLIRLEVMKERSYVPALMYVVFAFMTFEVIHFNEYLLGVSFILLALREMFLFLKTHPTDAGIFACGVYLSCAFLSDFAFLALVPAFILAMLTYTSIPVRKYLILVFGLVFPAVLLILFFYFNGGAEMFARFFFLENFRLNQISLMHPLSLLLIAGLPILILAIAMFRHLSVTGFVNFQTRCQRVMFLLTFFTAICLLLSDYRSPRIIILLVPSLTFFVSSWALLLRKALFRELSFLLILGWSILFCHLFISLDLFNLKPESLLLTEPEHASVIKEKKVLVLGPDINSYYGASQESRFFDWKISKRKLERLDMMKTSSEVFRSLRINPPELIIDQVGLAPAIFKRFIDLDAMYEPVNGTSGMYRRVPSS